MNVKFILLKLADHLNVIGIRGLAEYIGKTEGSVYSWVKRGKIGDIGCILGKVPYLNYHWLETGKGPMMTITDDNRHLIPDSLLVSDREGLVEPEISGKNSTRDGSVIVGNGNIQAGRTIKGDIQSNKAKQRIEDFLDDDELALILLMREYGGKAMVKKFTDEMTKVKKMFEKKMSE